MMSLTDKLKHYGFRRSVSYVAGELNVRVIHRLFLGSYSQSKEDLVLDKLLGYKKNGFYVDIGAYDPVWLSNTMRFYRRGWRGINVEPSTDNWKKFIRKRSLDINLNVGIGSKIGFLTYYAIDPPTLSTFSKQKADEYVESGYRLLSANKIQVKLLSQIFATYAKDKYIDFMSVDVEGFEMDVLKSNDWNKYRPTCICVESASEDGDAVKSKRIKSVITTYLSRCGYRLVFDNGLNSFYKETRE